MKFNMLLLVTSPSGGMRSIVMSMSVCLSVCPLAYRKNRNFLCMLVAAMAAIYYVLPVLWMTLCFHILWAPWGASCLLLCDERIIVQQPKQLHRLQPIVLNDKDHEVLIEGEVYSAIVSLTL